MSGFYASAGSQRIVAASVLLGYYGAPVADVTLATDAPLVSPVTVTIANLTLTMAVQGEAVGKPRQRSFAGQTTARLVGGAGAWSVPHKLSPYSRPTGVLLSMVLRDLAASATNTVSGKSESVKLATGADRSLGLQYVPDPGAPCARILRALAGALWWVDAAGVTQVGQTSRPTSTITSEARIERLDGGKNLLSVATEDVAAWVPGAFYASPTLAAGITVGSVRIAMEPKGSLRLEVMPL